MADPGVVEDATQSARAPSRLPAVPTRIVVVGASAGGIGALQELIPALPADFAGAVYVVQHMRAEADSVLPQLLQRRAALRVEWAEDGMPVEAGRVLLAPPDHHLLVEPQRLTVVQGPRENRHRPAIDPLFRSAAWAYGPRVVGVVLTGYLDDGTAGLWAIKSCGGVTVVQDPGDAQHRDMPANALLHNRVDHRLALGEIAPLLEQLVQATPGAARMAPEAMPLPDEIEAAKLGDDSDITALGGSPSAFTCPSCGGALWELAENGHLRYRCHTGHAYTQRSLMLDQDEAIEAALFSALRAVHEKSAALRRLADNWTDRFPQMQRSYEERAGELDDTAAALRGLLRRRNP